MMEDIKKYIRLLDGGENISQSVNKELDGGV